MAKRIRKYLIFAKSGMQTTMAYKGMIFLWFLGGIINAVIMCLLWWAIYRYSPENAIAGYTFPQMMLYMMLSAIVGELIFSETMSEIANDVHEGLIGMRLMKPVNYRAQLGFTTAGSFVARVAIIGLPMTVIGTLVAVFGFGLGGLVWYDILLFLPAVFIAVMFMDSLGFMFGQLAFRTHAMFGVSSIMNVLVGFLSGAMVPLALFPMWAQNVLAFTPFPSMMSMPIRLFMGMMEPLEILQSFGISMMWLVIFETAGQLMYKASVRHVVVFGG